MKRTKRVLGISYLIGTGLALIAIQGLRLVLFGPITATTITVTMTGMIAAGALVYAGYWLTTGSVADERIWAIAKWGSIGLGLFVALDLLLITLATASRRTIAISPGLLVQNITIGGVIGVLIGSAIEFKRAHENTRQLHEHNAVLNRALRHNIRNEMNVILGVIGGLETQLDPDFHHEFSLLYEKAQAVLKLGKQARLAEEARLREHLEPVEVRALIEHNVEELTREYPAASIDITGQSEAWVEATDLLGIVFENLLENAMDHHDGVQPLELEIQLARSPDDSTHRIRITDNGPGIPENEIKAIETGPPDPINHSTGMGLWLANWIVETFDGSLTVERDENRGTTVTVSLEAIEPPMGDPSDDPTEALGQSPEPRRRPD